MNLSQSFFNENIYYITPSQIIEFLYCKRFIYFMKCLGISQYEEKRFKVQLGRSIHEKKQKENKDYLRTKLNVIKKEINVPLISEKLGIKGIVDEVLTLEDKTMAPLDYKFAEYNDKIYDTYKTQIIMYALMIEEMYGSIVNKGYLVYCRNGHIVKEIEITDKSKDTLKNTIKEYLDVLQGYFPKATKYKSRCIDCCYSNICIK
ncbi:CRISPR-associated protein Cas4 [Tepidibacter formicigenes]|uniref:CRISPR-associated exonuclease Cas4 n=1 Tax=Tepidibacter formicigenes DSM 15518 TaxID=1123349 RepID=A0A1M6LML7_9FIRM|nr:CRISPR-associated protein Cas4 [Tepidibacter formicigenes]SHJ72459.1 CRISPR-associated exonuclease, Cas4 family [Tepidibacter formicigenes DSM 15518]